MPGTDPPLHVACPTAPSGRAGHFPQSDGDRHSRKTRRGDAASGRAHPRARPILPEGEDPDYPSLERLANRAFGIPLALELLAAQLREISLGDLLDDIAENEVGDQLRTILDYGYSALTEDEASVFRRISVLDGAVALGLIRGLVTSAAIPSTRVARLLGELTTRGLLSIDQSGARWRYEQHDDVRDYARDLLLAAGEEPETFALLASALRGMLPDDARMPPAPFTAAITEVLPSIRSLFGAALDGRASMADAQEIAFRLHRYYAATSVSEGRFWLGRLLASDETTEWTGLATFALGYLSYWAADGEAALSALSGAVELLRGVEDLLRRSGPHLPWRDRR